ncbi:MAG: methionine--tRNA ligase [Bacilli bacterium]|nr:methionine--tRNA ligase [Bacilli bacterium]
MSEVKKRCYVTTPIYYASGRVHIGNSYSTVVADAYARYHRLKGDDTFFLTGMDEHGLKIEEAAKKKDQSPQEFVDEIADFTNDLWKNLKITNDDFIRTSQERHVKVVQDVFEKLLESGDIYLGAYEGWYCTPCESFWTDTQVGENHVCPDCGREVHKAHEECYFLKLKKYEQQLLDFIKENPDFIQPETRKNEVVSFIESGLEDLCVSRTTIKWGIPVRSNPKHVVYVWIDALTNYISALGYSSDDDTKYQKYWLNSDEVIHVVGKDILRFHAVYWPIMCMALNVPITFKVYAHGWILMKEGKMSKSKGNLVYPMDVVNRYGLDALRYYLVKEMPLGNDGLFTWERFIERYNVDLANDLGNLVSRSISMINKYFGGTIVKNDKAYFTFDAELEEVAKKAIEDYQKQFEAFHFQDGLEAIWTLISRANKYIDETMPWALAKDESKKNELNDVLYHLYEVLRLVSIMIIPVMEDSANIIADELCVNDEDLTFDSLYFGKVKEAKVVEKAEVLFKRLNMNEELEKINGDNK